MSRYHDILGVSSNASQDEIKAAFRERALECHPDCAEEGNKEQAQEEFVRVREAFEILSDEEERQAPDATRRNGASERSRGAGRSFKEQWRKYKDEKVYVGRDIIENVRGLSSEYDLIRQKNSITVPLGSLLGASMFLYDPMAIYGTGIFLFDVLLCGLVGSVYGFAVGSLWAYLALFLGDYLR